MDNAEFLRILGARIKSLRKTQNISQERLAELAGLSIVFISNIENGRRRASICSYNDIAAALGLSLSELVEMPGEGETWDSNLVDVFQSAKKLPPDKQRIFIETAKGVLTGLSG